MTQINQFYNILGKVLVSSLVSIGVIHSTLAAPKLTVYIPEWSVYSGVTGYPTYPVDGAYAANYKSAQQVSNPDMLAKINKTDVLAYAFFQVWSVANSTAATNPIPANWVGHLHFDDIWGNLSNKEAPDAVLWNSACPTPTKNTKLSTNSNIFSGSVFAGGTCAAIQFNWNTQSPQLMDYNDPSTPDIGQIDNFGAFLRLKPSSSGKQFIKVISIGGANTLANKSISAATYDTIFATMNSSSVPIQPSIAGEFFNSLTSFLNTLQTFQTATVGKPNAIIAPVGVDYDFEPRIDSNGANIPPDNAHRAQITQDYQNLFNLVKATRAKLGDAAYISVTLTANEDYLNLINQAVPTSNGVNDSQGGWFKQISQYTNAINIMTYDLHGPWSPSSDPGALPHILLKEPVGLNPQHHYDINYGTEEVVQLLLGFGVDPQKLQVGLASYGRGFGGVAGTSFGIDQPWTSASSQKDPYTNGQTGWVPYRYISTYINSLGYLPFDILDTDKTTPIGTFIYSAANQEFIGYTSPELIDATCQFIKKSNLQGAILWSMDTDAPSKSNSSVVNNSLANNNVVVPYRLPNNALTGSALLLNTLNSSDQSQSLIDEYANACGASH